MPPLDGGASLYDLMGLYPGALSGPSWASGVTRPSRALAFNGTSTRVDIPGTWSLGPNDSTLAVWFRTTATTGATMISNASTASNNPMFGLLAPNASGFVGFYWRNDVAGPVGVQPLAGTTNRADGLWHHAVAVKGGVTGILYVDGQAEATASGTLTGTQTVSNLTLGCWRRTTNVSFFNGSIADASVWNRVLSPSEVLELYAEGLAGYPDTLLWRQTRATTLFFPVSSPPPAGFHLISPQFSPTQYAE